MVDTIVDIESLAFGGSGVGRIEGKVCFVPFSCPGDSVRVRITSEKKSFLTADVVEILTPSNERTEPLCPLFGVCGGCNWQHVRYHRQLLEKRRIFADTLWRGARVPDDVIGDVVCAPETYGYRSRVQFKLRFASGRLHMGFYRQGTHFVENAGQGCPIAVPVINDAFAEFRAALEHFPEPDRVPQINIDATTRGVVAVVNYIGHDPDSVAVFFNRQRHLLATIDSLYLQCGRKSTLRVVFGDGLLEYSLPADERNHSFCLLRYKPGGFAQVNHQQNVSLSRLVRTFAGDGHNNRLLDLFCGNGNFSLPLAASVSGITGIEDYPDSIAAARENALRNGIDAAEFICSDATGGLMRLLDEKRAFDTVILDPPRTGAAETVPGILRLNPARIIYISCDPSTLARDCALLVKGGYSVLSSIPIDMFPQTYHLESVTLLQPAGKVSPWV